MKPALKKGLGTLAATAVLWVMGMGVAFASTTGQTWTTADLFARINPIIAVIFPVVLFVAVIRLMWLGFKLATGMSSTGTSQSGGLADVRTQLQGTIVGVLIIMAAWGIVSVAMTLVQDMMTKK